MNPITKFARDISFILRSKKMLAYVADIDARSSNLLTDDFEKAVDQYSDNTAFDDAQRTWNYSQFDAYANQIAYWGLSQGLKRGDTVGFYSNNRLEYVAIWFGLSKIGVVTALLNFQLQGQSLAHCVDIAGCKSAIIEAELTSGWETATPFLKTPVQTHIAFDGGEFDLILKTQPIHRPAKVMRKGIKAGDTILKMFTSGTTGLPKAAKIPHTRAQYYTRGFVLPSKARASDKMMMVLPLYHATGGLCGIGVAILKGGCVLVRKKFSASDFWEDIRENRATLFMYVGELCRFLLNTPVSPKDKNHQIRAIIGNGLRPEIWEQFTTRFGIKNVVEFYGATEGNVTLINIDNKVGAVGRVPEFAHKHFNGDIVRYDVETEQYPKDKNGFYIRTAPDEVGELIGEVRANETRFRYDGYEDKSASSKKLLHNVFKTGDVWFHTGDLFRRDKDGYYYFVDRIGDTFRWKAENVSTNEVAGVLATDPGVLQANVYGVTVPGYDGKAGMAALVVGPKFDIHRLFQHVHTTLPSYARPVFIRISHKSATTTTFKYKKTDLIKDGFDPSKIADELYMDSSDANTYIALSEDLYKQIQEQKLRL